MLLMHTVGLQTVIQYCQFALFCLFPFVMQSVSLWVKLQLELLIGQHRAPISSSCWRDLLNLCFFLALSFFLADFDCFCAFPNMQGIWIIVFDLFFFPSRFSIVWPFEHVYGGKAACGPWQRHPASFLWTYWQNRKLKPTSILLHQNKTWALAKARVLVIY